MMAKSAVFAVYPNAHNKSILRAPLLETQWINPEKRTFISFFVTSTTKVDNPGTIIVRLDNNADNQKKYSFAHGSVRRKVTLEIDIFNSQSVQILIYFGQPGAYQVILENLYISNGRSIRYAMSSHWSEVETISSNVKWTQDGAKLYCDSFFGSYYTEFPCDWKIEDIPGVAFKVAEHYLFGHIFSHYFSENMVISEVKKDLEGYAKQNSILTSANTSSFQSKALLSFSFGVDSTAAAALLPEESVKFYLERPYSEFFTNSGRVSKKNTFPFFMDNYYNVPNLLVVKTTFELAAISAGMHYGFRHSWGYASIGILMAHILKCNTLCFGSVMQEMFLGAQSKYVDVVQQKTSGYNTNKMLFKFAGLNFGLPTGGLSEVLTMKVANEGKLKEIASFCPNIDEKGTPCNVCWKCFRKIRLAGKAKIKPSDVVYKLLAKKPIKQASTVIYACKSSGELEYLPESYHSLDVGFLERYYDYALKEMLSDDLYAAVKNELSMLGISPMTSDDILNMKLIGGKLI